MTASTFTAALVVAVGAGIACGARAQSAASTASSSAHGSATASAASFRCGGVGQSEQEAMNADAANHDLLLIFATPAGAYLADVDVQIISAKGQPVLQVRCDAPMMLIDLAGDSRYEVVATYRGQSQRKIVTPIEGRTARLVFTWPAG